MKINWFGDSFTIPLLLGIAVIAVVIVAVLAIICSYNSKKYYVCDSCGTRFKPRWYQFIFAGHVNDTYILRCPECHKKSACSPSYKQD